MLPSPHRSFDLSGPLSDGLTKGKSKGNISPPRLPLDYRIDPIDLVEDLLGCLIGVGDPWR